MGTNIFNTTLGDIRHSACLKEINQINSVPLLLSDLNLRRTGEEPRTKSRSYKSSLEEKGPTKCCPSEDSKSLSYWGHLAQNQHLKRSGVHETVWG
jgi:hypothetical protein